MPEQTLRLPSLPALPSPAPARTNIILSLPSPSQKPAYTVPSSNLSVSHVEVRERALQLAHVLRHKLGLTPGDVVAVFSSNCVEYPSAVLGCFAARTPCSPVNALFTSEELAVQLEDCRAKVVLVGPDQVIVAREAIASLPTNSVALYTITPSASSENCIWSLCDSSLQLDIAAEEVDDDETALLCYSSGTSGRPKGVQSTHSNLRATIACTVGASPKSFTRGDQGEPGECWVSVLPMSHMYGFGYHILLATFLCAHVVIIPGRFEPLHFLDVLEKYRVTAAHIVPPIAVRLTKDALPREYDLSALREWRTAAAPMGDKLSELLESRFGATVHSLYAMTETTAICLMSRQGEACPPGAAGVLAPGVEGKVVDGEFCVRGPNITFGYLRRPDANAESFDEEGFMRTGDLVRVEMRGDDAWVYVLDRKKEVIKWNGWQVAPAELEDVLLRHPAVADCAVLDVFDYGVQEEERESELVLACVVLRSLADASSIPPPQGALRISSLGPLSPLSESAVNIVAHSMSRSHGQPEGAENAPPLPIQAGALHHDKAHANSDAAKASVLGAKLLAETQKTAGGEAYAKSNEDALQALGEEEKVRLCGEIRTWVDGRVAPFKRLRGGVRIVARIPKSPAGKVLRRVLKEEVVQELKEEHAIVI